MEYDPQDYYSDGEDTPDEPTPAQPTQTNVPIQIRA